MVRNQEFGVESGSLFKCLQRLLEQLLVHVSDAEIVEAGGFGGLACCGRSFARAACQDGDRRQNDAPRKREKLILSPCEEQLTTKELEGSTKEISVRQRKTRATFQVAPKIAGLP